MKKHKRKLRKIARELKKDDWFREAQSHKGPLLSTAHPLDVRVVADAIDRTQRIE